MGLTVYSFLFGLIGILTLYSVSPLMSLQPDVLRALEGRYRLMQEDSAACKQDCQDKKGSANCPIDQIKFYNKSAE